MRRASGAKILLLLLAACQSPATQSSAPAGTQATEPAAGSAFKRGEYEITETTHVIGSAAPSTEKDRVTHQYFSEAELLPEALLKKAMPSSCSDVQIERDDNVYRTSGRCNTPDGDFRNMPVSATVTYYDDEIRIDSRTGLMGMTIEASQTMRRVGDP